MSDALNSILHSVPTYPSVFIAIFNCEMASQVVVKESAPWQHAPHSTHSNHPNAGASRGCSISTRSASSYRRRRPLIENRGRSSLQKYEGDRGPWSTPASGAIIFEGFASAATACAIGSDSQRCTATLRLLRPRAGGRARTLKAIRMSQRTLLQAALTTMYCVVSPSWSVTATRIDADSCVLG